MDTVKDFIHLIRTGKAQEAGLVLESIIIEKMAEKKMRLLKEAGMSDRSDKIRSRLSSLSFSTMKFKTKEEFDSKVRELTDSGREFDQYPDKLEIKVLTAKS